MPRRNETPNEDYVQDSPEKAAFREHIAKYAKQNPEKYALKKEALEEKLNSL